MESRKDWILKKIGITQYQLRYPHVFQGEITINVKFNTRLIIVSEILHILEKTLISDVLHAMNLKPCEVIVILPRQLSFLSKKIECACWLLGINDIKTFNGITIFSETYSKLVNSSEDKRILWKQICKHKTYFFS